MYKNKSLANKRRAKQGWYKDLRRIKKWGQCARQANATKKKRNLEITLTQLKNLQYDFLKKLKLKSFKQTSNDLRQLGIKYPKVAIRILRSKYDDKILLKICKIRKINNISKIMRYKIEHDKQYRLQCIKNLGSPVNKKYRSKNEQRLRYWLIKNYPKYNWGSRHLFWKDKVYEFDIYSKTLKDFFIEYNGIVHYKPIYGKTTFNRIKTKDRVKKKIMKVLSKKFLIVDDGWSFDKQIKVVEQFLN